MAKRRKKKPTLFELLRDRLRILMAADDELVVEIQKTESSIWRSVLAFMRQFTVRNGRLVKESNSTRLNGLIAKQTKKIIRDSTLDSKIADFLPNFDEVDRLAAAIYAMVIPNPKIPDTKVAKRQAIETVTTTLGDLKALDPVYIKPLQRRIFQAVQTQMKFSDAVDSLRVYVKGTTPSGGELARYSRQVSADVLNGYSGFIDQQIAEANDLDGFFFSGSLINTSRRTCIDMVKGAGEFASLAIEPGLFPVSAIPEIVKRGKNNKGWRPETNAANYPILRNGYNCRHNLIYTSLSTDEAQQARNAALKRASDQLEDFDPRPDSPEK